LKTPLSDKLSPITLTDVMPARWLVESAPPPPQPTKTAAAAVASSATFHFMDFIFHLFVLLLKKNARSFVDNLPHR
jgi:hypothetical protein